MDASDQVVPSVDVEYIGADGAVFRWPNKINLPVDVVNNLPADIADKFATMDGVDQLEPSVDVE